MIPAENVTKRKNIKCNDDHLTEHNPKLKTPRATITISNDDNSNKTTSINSPNSTIASNKHQNVKFDNGQVNLSDINRMNCSCNNKPNKLVKNARLLTMGFIKSRSSNANSINPTDDNKNKNENNNDDVTRNGVNNA